MIEPQEISPGTIMPAYPWMIDDDLDVSLSEKKISVMRKLGVPYEEGYENKVLEDMDKQATGIAQSILKDLKKGEYSSDKVNELKKKEIIALIAYLQRLGSDIHNTTEQTLDTAITISEINNKVESK